MKARYVIPTFILTVASAAGAGYYVGRAHERAEVVDKLEQRVLMPQDNSKTPVWSQVKDGVCGDYHKQKLSEILKQIEAGDYK